MIFQLRYVAVILFKTGEVSLSVQGKSWCYLLTMITLSFQVKIKILKSYPSSCN